MRTALSQYEISVQYKSQTPYTYKLILTETKTQLKIQLGSDRKAIECRNLIIYKGTMIASDGFYEYAIDCASNRDLERGLRGSIPMLYTCLKIAQELFPEITTLQFEDQSKIRCDGGIMELSNLKFLTEGRTWYQKYYPGLKPHTELEKEVVRDNLICIHQSIRDLPDLLKIIDEEADNKSKMWLTKERVLRIEKLWNNGKLRNQKLVQVLKNILDDPILGCPFFVHFAFSLHRYGYESLDAFMWETSFSSLQSVLQDVRFLKSEEIEPVEPFATYVYGQRGGSPATFPNNMIYHQFIDWEDAML